jgi:hypothetical protein
MSPLDLLVGIVIVGITVPLIVYTWRGIGPTVSRFTKVNLFLLLFFSLATVALYLTGHGRLGEVSAACASFVGSVEGYRKVRRDRRAAIAKAPLRAGSATRSTGEPTSLAAPRLPE